MTVRVPPVYETRRRVVTIPAVYEERPRRIWREPVYETRRVLVELPAKTVSRRVARHGRYGTILGHRVVTQVVEPARRVWRTERVLVRPGYYETVYERVCVAPESTKVVFEKVLVQPRHRTHPRAVRVHHGPRHGRLVPLRPRHRHRDDAFRVALHLGR
jgi:xanthine/CO dehydrogenase XdhC/CoxF family maturation factor